MYYLIVPRRRLGQAIDRKELGLIQPIKGDIHIMECHEDFLGRTTATAWIFNSSPGSADCIPRLLDVKITGMSHNGMNLSGVERVDDCLYAQSWWCRIE
jgi:hypothetical protein